MTDDVEDPAEKADSTTTDATSDRATADRQARLSLWWNEPLAVELTAAVQRGDSERLRRMLAARPELARARIVADGDSVGSRTLLHLFADWPGHRRNPRGIVVVLRAAGADLDAGADIDAPGCVVNGLGPVADAAIFGGVRAGRRLVERGAVTNIYQAAALGFADLVRTELASEPGPDAERVTAAFWAACGNGNREIATLLVANGADVDWVGWGGKTALDQARASDADELAAWLESLGARSAAELGAGPEEAATPGNASRHPPAHAHVPLEGEQVGFAPCFPTKDMRAALAHYRKLGFTVMPYSAGAEWGWARFERAEIHLYLKEDHDPARTASAADLEVLDCDALEREWSATGAPGTSDRYTTTYARREAVHVDVDGNLIRFGSPVPGHAEPPGGQRIIRVT